MPYILQKRSDIDPGTFRTLGLIPNESQRNPPYKPVGQTGYRKAPPNAAPSVVAGVTLTAGTGLASYLLANVSSEAGTEATADITTVAVASLIDGDFFTVSDGVLTAIFEFNVSGTHFVTAGRIEVDVSADTTADDVRDTLFPIITAAEPDITAVNGGVATVTMTNNNQNQLTADQNATNSEDVANAGFLVPDFTGGTDSDSLTQAEVIVSAQDILDELAFGDVGTAASALTVTAINAAMTTGGINKAQVVDILDILAGRNYEVPAGVTVETAGEFIPGTGAFDDAEIAFRRVYLTGALRISFDSGRLSIAASDNFTFAGIAGAAVAVYNDDGSLFTG